jgi:mannose-6-phosphate isomerase-like protein (cupin superfamily)
MPCPFFAKQNVPTSWQEIGATKTFQYSPKTAITAIKLWRYAPSPRCSIHQKAEQDVERKTPTIIDLDAETAKLTMFYGRTPQTTFAERRGSAVQLGRYRDGILLLSKSAGTGHWETHPADELLYVLDGAMTVDIAGKDGPQSFTIGAGMIGIVPPHAWHRVRSADGMSVMSATIPGDHIDLDVHDLRMVEHKPAIETETASSSPSIVDLNAEVAKLKMFRRTPSSTAADRKGSVAQLASYRDGLLLALKASGKDHWERHLTGDELIYILDGAATLEIVCDDGPPQSFALRGGMIAVIPQGAWHRFHSSEGAAQMAVTPFPGEHIELDVDDPREAERKPA